MTKFVLWFWWDNSSFVQKCRKALRLAQHHFNILHLDGTKNKEFKNSLYSTCTTYWSWGVSSGTTRNWGIVLLLSYTTQWFWNISISSRKFWKKIKSNTCKNNKQINKPLIFNLQNKLCSDCYLCFVFNKCLPVFLSWIALWCSHHLNKNMNIQNCSHLKSPYNSQFH